MLDSDAGQDFEVLDSDEGLGDYEVIEELTDEVDEVHDLRELIAVKAEPLPVVNPHGHPTIRDNHWVEQNRVADERPSTPRQPIRPKPRTAPVRTGARSGLPTALPSRGNTAPTAHSPATSPQQVDGEPITAKKPATKAPAKKAPAKKTPVKKAAASTKQAADKKPVERLNTKRITPQDIRMFHAMDWMGRSTVTHISFAVGNLPKNIGQRLLSLKRRGWVTAHGKNEGMIQYSLTKRALEYIGSIDKPMEEPAPSTMSHRNKLNSMVIHMRIGAEKWAELTNRHAEDQARVVRSKIRSVTDYNEMLAEKQEALSQIPERERTEEERRTLRKRPRTVPVEQEVMGIASTGTYLDYPQAAIAERVIRRDMAAYGELACSRDFSLESKDFAQDPSFPMRHMDDDTPVTDEEIEALYRIVDGRGWIFRHWDLMGKFGKDNMPKRHMPDGVLLLPHRVQPDGQTLPGSYWLELEDTRKTLDEIIRACKQAIDHPLLRGTMYFTNDQRIVNLLKRARESIARERSKGYRDEGMGAALADERAALEVKDAILIKRAPLLNASKADTGFWG
ncbi:hypothetical protein [Citricoccus nitrophenolicus]|uniref:hypothetical protein n=1 Tax=Citricoccus nitrophenolicus TaxID=863575 RepID=UPI0031EA6BD5